MTFETDDNYLIRFEMKSTIRTALVGNVCDLLFAEHEGFPTARASDTDKRVRKLFHWLLSVSEFHSRLYSLIQSIFLLV